MADFKLDKLSEKSIIKLSKKAKLKGASTKQAMQLFKQKENAKYKKMIKFYKMFKALKLKAVKKYSVKGKQIAKKMAAEKRRSGK